jgi:hypothetical protein
MPFVSAPSHTPALTHVLRPPPLPLRAATLTGTGLYASLAQQRALEVLMTDVSLAGSRPMLAPNARASDNPAI